MSMAHKTEKKMIHRSQTQRKRRSNIAKSTKANTENTKRISSLSTDIRLETKKKKIIYYELRWKFRV